MPRLRDNLRDFPGKRWANLALRTVHLLGVVLFGAALLGTGNIQQSALLVFVSGLLMFAIDIWANPAHLREIAGFGVVIKLCLLGLSGLHPQIAMPAFWAVLVLSSVLSHASGAFRHRRLF